MIANRRAVHARGGALLAAASVICVFAAVVGTRATTASSQSTVRDGVYTAAQATRGKATFDATCATCHAVDVTTQGKEGPALVGPGFFANWDGRDVYSLVTQIRLTMPPDGSVILDGPKAADLIAFIFQSNKFPAGESELKADTSTRDIKIVSPSAGGASIW